MAKTKTEKAPKPSRKARPSNSANPGGETNVPLIVALVFFVLTTLGLGIAYYTSIDAATKAEADRAKAETDKTAAEGLRRVEQEKNLMLKAMAGFASQADLDALKNLTKKAEVVEAYNEYAKELAGKTELYTTAAARDVPGTPLKVTPADVYQWTSAAAGTFDAPPEKPILAGATSALGRQLLATVRLQTAEKQTQDAAKNYNDLAQAYDRSAKALAEVAKSFPKELQDKVAEVTTRYNAEIAKFEGATKVYTRTMNDKANENAAQQYTIEQEQLRNKNLNTRAENAERIVINREDAFAGEKSHGRVTKRDNDTVYIDLGSADNVRPGLTFVVQPPDTDVRGVESRRSTVTNPDGTKSSTVQNKGTLQVIDVVAPHLSRARISGQTDRIRDAILPGDLLYNAAWKKGQTEHVALYGLFDVDGDGRDDTQRLIGELKNAGVVVDAYFDLSKGEWAGRLSNTTSFAVEGYYPVVSGGDTLSGEKAGLIKKLDAAKVQAQNQGIRVVRSREFFTRIGYPTRGDTSPEVINRAYNTFLNRAAPATPPAGDAPAGN